MSSNARGRRFAVLFIAGTGSTYLTELLRQHPRVEMHGEVLARIDTAAEQHAFLRDFYSQEREDALGLKAKVPQVRDEASFLDAVAPFDLVYFRLVRRNRVKHAVSLLRSEVLAERAMAAVGRRHSNIRRTQLEEHPELELGALTVDIPELLGTLEEIERREEELDAFLARCCGAHGSPGPVPIVYEDLLADAEGFMGAFYDAIEVHPVPVAETNVIKKTADDLRSVIANYDEVDAALAATPYTAMLAER